MKVKNIMLCATAVVPSLAWAKELPNIIYIVTDQQTASAMSCMGNDDLHTPNMDKLAQAGVLFRNAYCSTPLSGPARAAMFTGYTSHEVGLARNGTPIPDSLRTRTLGTLMQNAGYDCIYAGKWHVHTASMPDKEFGFTTIHPHSDNGLAEACVGFLEQKHTKPFFLVDVISYEQSLNYSAYPTRNYTPDDWRRYRNLYYRLVEKVDAEIGKILNAIDKQDLWKNTVVIFTSDHGDGVGAHHWNQKSALYEEVVNIPLIVTLPGKKNAGKEMPQLVNNGVDFFAAVCDWAGIRLPEGLHGVSFRSLAEKADPSLKHQDYIVTETTFDKGGNTRGWALRTSRYKYVLYDKGRYREQLFDMEKDRGEMRNLAIEEKYKEILLQHREYLHDWMKLHHVAQIRKDVHTIPGVNPE